MESVDKISKVFWTFLVLFKPKVNDNSLRNQLPLVIPWKMTVKDLICEWLQLSASKFLNTGIRIPRLSCIFIFKCSSVALIFPSYYHNTYCVCMRTHFWIHLVHLASRLYKTHCGLFPFDVHMHLVCQPRWIWENGWIIITYEWVDNYHIRSSSKYFVDDMQFIRPLNYSHVI